MTSAAASPIFNRSLSNPLGTARIRQAYMGNMTSRFGRLKSLLRISVADRDAFGLRKNQQTGPKAGAPARSGEFFGPNDRATDAFASYVTQTAEQVITQDEDLDDPDREPYYFLAIGLTYQQALRRAIAVTADTRLTVSELAAFPTQREALEILKARQFERLKGITSDMGTQLRSVVSQGLREGIGKTELAGRIARGVDKMKFTRAHVLAATEITNAHAEATLNAFRTLGIREVRAEVEFTLNVHGKAEPCPDCIGLSGNRYTLSRARGIIPVHPRCQCGWLPVEA